MLYSNHFPLLTIALLRLTLPTTAAPPKAKPAIASPKAKPAVAAPKAPARNRAGVPRPVDDQPRL